MTRKPPRSHRRAVGNRDKNTLNPGSHTRTTELYNAQFISYSESLPVSLLALSLIPYRTSDFFVEDLVRESLRLRRYIYWFYALVLCGHLLLPPFLYLSPWFLPNYTVRRPCDVRAFLCQYTVSDQSNIILTLYVRVQFYR